MKVEFYQNKRNENKYLEVHHSNCGHYTVAQFMNTCCGRQWTGVRHNRRKMHRWKKADLNALLEDYKSVVEPSYPWQHIDFVDGSNPFVCTDSKEFEYMKSKYRLKPILVNGEIECFWLAESKF